MTSNDRRCFKIDSIICGHSLSRCVVYVGIANIIISLVAMMTAIANIVGRTQEASYNTKPLVAMNMIFSMTCISVSAYQIIISILLLTVKNSLIISLWYVSHMSIIVLYLMLFTARIFISVRIMQYAAAAFTVIICIVYEGVIVFFMVIINSYMKI